MTKFTIYQSRVDIIFIEKVEILIYFKVLHISIKKKKRTMCYFCHTLDNNPGAPPHKSENCRDPRNSYSKKNGGAVVARRTNAVAFIMQGSSLFMVNCAPPGSFPKWTPPGGIMEHGETAQQAALREACEETGMSFVPATVQGTELYHGHTYYVFCRATGAIQFNKTSRNTETFDGRWFSLAELEQLEVLGHLRYRAIIQYARQHLK